MARIWRHRRAIAVAFAALAGLLLAPAFAEDQGQDVGTDLYDQPVLAVDPGMHTATIWSQAVDAEGRFGVTGGADRTLRIWSVADGKLLRTIFIPVGPDPVGEIVAVAIGPDGSTIAAGGFTEKMQGGSVVYLFDRESGDMVRRIGGLPNVVLFLGFSPDGRYLAAMLGGANGLRVFDREKDWSEAFRDASYGDDSYGAAFAPDGRLATTSFDGKIRLYAYDPDMRVQTKGEFGGLGIRLTQEDGLIKVVTAIKDTPAAKAGVLSGDVITAIDDAPTQGLTLGQAVEKMRGVINTPVKLKIVRGPKKEVKEFTIVRDLIRVQSVFRRVGEPVRAPSGLRPFGISFSPGGNRLAVGYSDVAAVDLLDAGTLNRIGGQSPANATTHPGGLAHVRWSHDGQTLYAAGAVSDAQGQALLFAWDGGLGGERRLTNCAPDTAAGVDALADGRILVASIGECLGLMDADGKPVWTVAPPVLDFREQRDVLKVSQDGKVVDFGYRGSAGAVLRFDLRSLALSNPPPNDKTTFAPNREGLTIDGWRNGTRPTLNGRAIPIEPYERGRSLAVASDAKRFFLGSNYALKAFDDAGAQKWRRRTRARCGPSTRAGTDGSSSRPKATARSAGIARTTGASCWRCRCCRTRPTGSYGLPKGSTRRRRARRTC